ncbi:MAG: M48 family metalloprotease [Alphaproteobacteria bacterium]
MKINRRNFGKGFLASCATLGLSGCARNIATGRMSLIGTSVKYDIEDTKKNHAQVLKENGGEYENIKVQNYVTKIGNELAKHVENQEYKYRFFVLDAPDVNAFAVSGGYIYIYRGLLSYLNSEAELASILGHELGHVNARHISEAIAQYYWAKFTKLAIKALMSGNGQTTNDMFDNGLDTLTSVLLRGFTRKQEFEADKLGIRYMSKAGYDPEASVAGFETFYAYSKLAAVMNGGKVKDADKIDIMETHPRTKERIQKAIIESSNALSEDFKLNKKPFFEAIEGLVCGNKIGKGFLKGKSYTNPELRISFNLPENLRPASNFDDIQEGLVFVDEKKEEFFIVSKNEIMYEIKKATMKDYVKKDKDEQSYYFRFIDTKNNGDNFDDWEEIISKSFKRYSEEEAKKIEPSSIHVLKNVSNKTVSELAENMPYGKYNNAYFRVLNGLGLYDFMLAKDGEDLCDEEIERDYIKVFI